MKDTKSRQRILMIADVEKRSRKWHILCAKWGGRWDSNPVPRITSPVLALMSYGHHRVVRGSRPTRFELAPTLSERGALSI